MGDPDPISAGTAGEAARWGGSSAVVGMAANPLGAHRVGAYRPTAWPGTCVQAMMLLGVPGAVVITIVRRAALSSVPEALLSTRYSREIGPRIASDKSLYRNQNEHPCPRGHSVRFRWWPEGVNRRQFAGCQKFVMRGIIEFRASLRAGNMNGPYRVFVWLLALFGAGLPFATLYFFLPYEILDSNSYVPIPDKLITDYAFIGVAVFISCMPDWLCDDHFSSFKMARKRWIISFRSAAFIFAFSSFFHYIRIELNLNNVFDQRFFFNLESSKLSLMWCVIAVIGTSLAAIVLHQGRSAEVRAASASGR